MCCLTSITSVRCHVFNEMLHGMGKQTFFLLFIFTIGQVGPIADLHVLHISKSNLKIRYDNRPNKIKQINYLI